MREFIPTKNTLTLLILFGAMWGCPLFGESLAIAQPAQNRSGNQPRANRSNNAARRPPRLPESVRLIENIPYTDTDNPRQQLDLLLPKERPTEALPVIVFIHGGAWRAGNKAVGRFRLAPFVATGKYAGVTVAYRLTDEAQWPSQLHDCQAAIRWIRAHAEEHNLDPDRIALWGTSAGGHLVSMLGTSGGVEELNGQLPPNQNLSARVTCVVNFFGPSELLTMNEMAIPGATMDHNAPDSPESVLIGGTLQEHPERAKSASPLTFVSPDDPPFLNVHGTEDPLVAYKQSQVLDQKFEEHRVESTLLTVDGGGHGQGFGQQVNETVKRFFAHHLLGQESEWNDATIRSE